MIIVKDNLAEIVAGEFCLGCKIKILIRDKPCFWCNAITDDIDCIIQITVNEYCPHYMDIAIKQELEKDIDHSADRDEFLKRWEDRKNE